MKKLLLATASLIVIAGSASAADLAVKARPIIAAPACAQFGGFYVGGNVGWKYYDHKWHDKDNFWDGYFEAGNESDNGFTAGVQAGYNLQFHCTVWGIQADWNWTNADANGSYTLPGFLESLDTSSKEKWYGTLRTRSGVVVDNLLLYVTGGLAWAKFDRTLAYGDPLDGFWQTWSSSKTKLGFVVGAGTEWALNQNWSINSEFLYMAFEKDTQNFDFFGVGYRYDFKDSEWVAKIGVNYRFGGYAPVVAAY